VTPFNQDNEFRYFRLPTPAVAEALVPLSPPANIPFNGERAAGQGNP
jgi:hypothetical protein